MDESKRPAAVAFGAEVRRRREALGWTLQDLSDSSGLARNYLSPVENGKRDPSLSTIMKIAEAFELQPADLLGGLDLEPAAVEAAGLFTELTSEVREEVLRLMRLMAKASW